LTAGSLKEGFMRAEQKLIEHQRGMRRLSVELAARAYELEKGHPPSSLSDLVPDYLTAIPQDPLTGTNMVFSP
jgi:hypothetical protein